VTPASAASAKLIDGKAIADTIRKEVAEKVAAMKAKSGKARAAVPATPEPCRSALPLARLQVPGLAVVLVGERKARSASELRRRGP